jgi:hypothetical protein
MVPVVPSRDSLVWRRSRSAARSGTRATASSSPCRCVTVLERSVCGTRAGRETPQLASPRHGPPLRRVSCPAAEVSCRDGDCLLQSPVVALAPCVGGRRAVCWTPSVPSHAGRRRGDHSISVPSQPAPSPAACRCCARLAALRESPGTPHRASSSARGCEVGALDAGPILELRRAPDFDRCKPERVCSSGRAR